MPDEAHRHREIMHAARQSLREQRAGGRRVRSIGRGSAQLKTPPNKAKLTRIIALIAPIFFAVTIGGIMADGIGISGLMLTVLLGAVVAALLARYPRLKPPPQARLNEGDARTMVARTELWLEGQRPALPPPAVELVDRIGVQLDALGLQLEGVGERPETVEVRKLVGEHLPEMISTYRRIPAHLRQEPRGDGRTPDAQLADGLGKISGEIDAITRQLAAGDLDNLQVRGRYLDYKYGGALEDRSGDVEKPA